MNTVKKLSYEFRKAIEKAIEVDELGTDFAFKRFPRGCCGDTSYLLAEYLFQNGIVPSYVCGVYRGKGPENMQSHAWLLTDDDYIIDITGDQFHDRPVFLNYDESVYVGKMDEFHQLFEVEDIQVHEIYGISEVSDFCSIRLRKLYNMIVKYL